MTTQITGFIALRKQLEAQIIGQKYLTDRLLIGLLTGGHILLEGPPGLAKTTSVKALATAVHADFQRIQFTPDLLPADLTGGEIFNPESRQFEFIKGPVFNQILLADEINRAPPKIQSALLEAMQEHQVTVNGVTRDLPDLFLVLATQNPLEQSGTYPLPEAQLDRFLLHLKLDYPSPDNELLILQQDRKNFQHQFSQPEPATPAFMLSPADVINERQKVANTYIDETLEQYIVDIVTTTRQIAKITPQYSEMIDYGASPRASIALYKAASAVAYLNERDYVIPEDIHAIAADVLRHRIILNFNASTQGITKDDLINKIIEHIPIP